MVLGALLLTRKRKWMCAAGCGFWVLCWGIHYERLERQAGGEAWFQASGRAGAELEGAVVSLREHSGRLPRAIFRVSEARQNPQDLRGCFVALDDLPDGALPGDRLLLKGRTFFPASPRNPEEFDRGGWLRSHGVSGEVRMESSCVLEGWRGSLSLRRLAWILRMDLRSRIVAGLREESTESSRPSFDS